MKIRQVRELLNACDEVCDLCHFRWTDEPDYAKELKKIAADPEQARSLFRSLVRLAKAKSNYEDLDI